MNLLSGLEKFGFQATDLDIMKEEATPETSVKKEVVKKEDKTVAKESDYLLERTVTCPICERKIKVKDVKKTRLRRMESDFDMRPNFENIDTLKYDVWVCNYCGYGAMTRCFDGISTAKAKLIKQEVCAKFKPMKVVETDTYTYDYAVELYKLSLLSTMAKRGTMAEKAYTCLKIAWIRRTQVEILRDDVFEEAKHKQLCQKEFEAFYQQAYDGLIKACATESQPYCGMDTTTVEYIIANMSMYYKKYDVASKLVARLLVTPSVPRVMKDRCLDMKDEILLEIRKKKEGTN